MTQNPTPAYPKRKSRVAYWFFWGTIATMTLGTVGLQIFGSKKVAKPSLAPAIQDSAPTASEMTADAFREALEGVPDLVLDQVLPNLDPLLDSAFQPAYERVEDYTDFHYSIRGEYTELGGALFARLEDDLEERLFAGLSERLNSVSSELDESFLRAYERTLGEKIRMASKSVDIGEATRNATQGAIQRVKVTMPIAAATTVAGAVSIKVISKVVAKKVAIKFAGKGLLKGGSLLTGAGTGAALCAPAGPAAAVCGIAGAVVAGLTVDAIVIEADEWKNREDFEQNLRQAIDDEKYRVRSVLTQQLQVKQLELVRMAPQQAQDLTLAQLASARRIEICEIAENLLRNYRMIQSQIAARSPRNLALFTAELDDASQIATLLPLVDDMRSSIDRTVTFSSIDSLLLRGNFRTTSRANRDVTAQLRIEAIPVNFERVKASKKDGFSISSPSDIRIDTLGDVNVLAAIEQHLHIRSNRFFGGHIVIKEILSKLEDVNGLQGTVQASLPLVLDEKAKSIAEVHKPQGASSIFKLAMTITAETLRDPVPFSACAAE